MNAELRKAEWRARFRRSAGLPGEAPEIPWLRQVLLRRTPPPLRPARGPRGIAAPVARRRRSRPPRNRIFSRSRSIRVAEARGRRDRLAALVPDMPWIGAAPVFLVFCGDARRLERLGELRGQPQDNGRLEGFFNAAVDAALVMQSLDPGGRNRRPRLLPDQRDPQPCRCGRRRSWNCRTRSFRSPACASATRRRGLYQHAPAARRHPPHRPLRRFAALAENIDDL